MANRLFTCCVSLVLAIGMTACGGGGADDKGATPSSSTQIDATKVNRVEAGQGNANAMVQVALVNVDPIVKAAGLNDIPGGAPTPSGAQRVASIQSASNVMVQPSTVQTHPCSKLGGGNGSGSYTADVDYNAATGEFNSRINYDQCTYSFGGNTFTLNGYSISKSSQPSVGTTVDYTEYDWTVQISGPNAGTYTHKGSQTCTYSNASYSCSYNIGDSAVSSISGVSVNGNTTKITSATIKTKRDDSANSLTVTYTNWQYDSASGRASGTVTITDTLGNTATVVANGNTYTVTIKYNGVESTYTVTV